MTFAGWFVFALISLLIIIGGFVIGIDGCDTTGSRVATAVICIALILVLLFGMLWFFNNTATGQRALVDQKSNLNNGMERTVTVYTADGEIIATYTGLIDIDTNDGGYVKFDFEGKRYIYYNCFVETIAEIS